MRQLKLIAALVAAGMISACGGGGGGGDSAQSIAGLWNGSTSNGRQVSALTFSDGSTWAVYTPIGGGNVIAGVVQGTLNGSARDYNFESNIITQGNLTATVNPKQNISGTVSSSSGSLTFSGTYDAAFEQTPSLAAVTGTFTGQARVAAGTEGATVTVTSSGAISGSSASGCSYTGTATPRADGNAFNISVTFGGGVCALGTSTVTGVAYYDTADRTLIAAALNAARDNGFLFLGTKP